MWNHVIWVMHCIMLDLLFLFLYYLMVNIAKLFKYQNAGQLLKYCKFFFLFCLGNF